MKVKRFLKALRTSSAIRLLKESPVWFVTPALVLTAGVAVAANGYEPLVFDASQYQTQTAQAQELDKTVDAAKLEKKSSFKSKKEKAAQAAKAAQSSAASSAAKAKRLAKATLADGAYTGFSRCTEEDVFDYYLRLTIKVEGGKVVDVYDVRGSSTGDSGDVSLDEYDSVNDTYIAKASASVLSQLKSAGKSGKTPTDIDTVSGATYSSSSMLEAYLDALQKSAAAAGNKASSSKKDTGSKGNGSKKDDSSKKDPQPDPSPAPVPDPQPDEDVDYGTGVWTAYAYCVNKRQPAAYTPYYIGVTVETLGGKVVAVKDVFGDDQDVVDADVVYDDVENKFYLDRALSGYGTTVKHPGVLAQLEAIIASGKADGNVDTVSGATYSSRAILEAYRAAIEQARQAAAASADKVDDAADEGSPDTAGDDVDSSSSQEGGSSPSSSAPAASGAGFARMQLALRR